MPQPDADAQAGVSRSRTIVRRVRRLLRRSPSPTTRARRSSESLPVSPRQPEPRSSPIISTGDAGLTPRLSTTKWEASWAPELTEIDINDVLRKPLSAFPTAYGAFGNVWRGQYKSRAVALKQLRPHKFPHKEKKRFYQEAYVWNSLESHCCVLPLLGITRDEEGHLYMIAPWMKNGNLTAYLSHAEPLSESARVHLLFDISRGLLHLHKNQVVHGDLRGDNILISDDGEACLSDFGLSIALDKLAIATHETSLRDAGATRWMAPERFQRPSLGVSMMSDIYSVPMVGIEIYTLAPPFSELVGTSLHDLEVFIQQGQRPARPTDDDGNYTVSDNLWLVFGDCWHQEPTKRPNAEALLSSMHSLASQWSSSQRDLSPIRRPRENLPAAINISGQVIRVGAYPAASGSFSTVWRGEWRPLTLSPRSPPIQVALKVLRVRTAAYSEMWKRLLHEARILAPLKHENIVPLYGVTLGDDTESPHYCSLVYPWFPRGNVLDYLANQKRSDMERLRLTRDVASGLAYLHSQTPAVIHADLKPSNVLVNELGHAAICDFGLSGFATDDNTSISAASSASISKGGAGAMRYAAPELLKTEVPKYTTSSDVWSFGCVAAEILYEQAPYSTHNNVFQMVLAMDGGEMPVALSVDSYHGASFGPFAPRAVDLPRHQIIQCWSREIETRPGMIELAIFFGSVTSPPTSTSLTFAKRNSRTSSIGTAGNVARSSSSTTSLSTIQGTSSSNSPVLRAPSLSGTSLLEDGESGHHFTMSPGPSSPRPLPIPPSSAAPIRDFDNSSLRFVTTKAIGSDIP